MALAASQARLLALTARKHDCEYAETLQAARKMALTRETSELQREYHSKLQAKNIAYYANGKYNKINYNYLMGSPNHGRNILNEDPNFKTNTSMILCDYKGQVVLSEAYASIIKNICPDAVGSKGEGKTFSSSYIPNMLAEIIPYTPEQIKSVMEGGTINASNTTTTKDCVTNEDLGKGIRDYSSNVTEGVAKLIAFYEPIFLAAATNGWTTEYNQQMTENDDYLNDALNSGTFQLVAVTYDGNYEPNTSLEYFLLSDLKECSNTDDREELKAWFDAESSILTEKETEIDLKLNELSSEIEAIKTEMESIQSLIQDSISSVFDWGSS